MIVNGEANRWFSRLKESQNTTLLLSDVTVLTIQPSTESFHLSINDFQVAMLHSFTISSFRRENGVSSCPIEGAELHNIIFGQSMLSLQQV